MVMTRRGCCSRSPSCYPWSCYREHALLAIDQGKHVLVEKPATCTAADTEEIVKKVIMIRDRVVDGRGPSFG